MKRWLVIPAEVDEATAWSSRSSGAEMVVRPGSVAVTGRGRRLAFVFLDGLVDNRLVRSDDHGEEVPQAERGADDETVVVVADTDTRCDRGPGGDGVLGRPIRVSFAAEVEAFNAKPR